MISFTKLKKFSHPSRIRGALNYLGVEANRRLQRGWYSESEYTLAVEEDWDSLFILDGCRYDVFEDECDLNGNIAKIRSPASYSNDYLRKNFKGRELHDTVYITANPHIRVLPEGTFHDVIDLLDSDWDEELQTVPPRAVANAVRDAIDQYPEKRLIAHFMQPHYPFIGDVGRQINQGGFTPGSSDNEAAGSDIWTMLQFGRADATVDKVWEAYKENLDLVLRECEKLLNEIPGKTAITSDHGNMIGERMSPIPIRGWGHPPDILAPELLNVPWFVTTVEQRREISSEPPKSQERLDDEIAEQRLAALGYK